jgi:5'(3')-deoxyribonucleotidase
MRKQTIAVDVDDVLAEHVNTMIDWSNKNLHLNLTPKDYGPHYHIMWNVSVEEAEMHTIAFHESGVYKDFAVIDKAFDALQILKQSYDLVVVTARRKMVINESLEWINQFFPNIFRDVHFVPVWEPNSTVSKADICQNIGAAYLIDDLPRHCNVAAEAGISSLLFGQYSWNKDDAVNPLVTRVKNWQAVLEYFNA